LLLKKYFIGLLNANVIEPSKVTAVFGPIDEVVGVAVRTLAQLGSIDDAIANARTFACAKSLLVSVVAGEPLTIYARYLNTLRRRLRRLDRLAHREPALGAFVSAAVEAADANSSPANNSNAAAAATAAAAAAASATPRSPRPTGADNDEEEEPDIAAQMQVAPLAELLRRPVERLCNYAFVCRQLSDSGGFGNDLRVACEALEKATSSLSADPTLLTGPPPFLSVIALSSAAAALGDGEVVGGAAPGASGTFTRRLGSALKRAGAQAVQHANTLRTRRTAVGKLFGVELDAIAPDGVFPEPIELALAMMRNGTMTPQDLLAPSKTPIAELKTVAETCYATGRPFDIEEDNAADLLKLFLQLLPQPVFPTAMYPDLMAIVPKARANAPELCSDLSRIISRLSSTRITFLRRLCATLMAVASRHPKSNASSASSSAAGSTTTSNSTSEGLASVAIVFGPLLVRSGKRADKSSFESRFTEAGDTMAFTLAVLAHADELVGTGRVTHVNRIGKVELDSAVDLSGVSRGGDAAPAPAATSAVAAAAAADVVDGSPHLSPRTSSRDKEKQQLARSGNSTPVSPRVRAVDTFDDVAQNLTSMTLRADNVVDMLQRDSEFSRISMVIIDDQTLARLSRQIDPAEVQTSLSNLNQRIEDEHKRRIVEDEVSVKDEDTGADGDVDEDDGDNGGNDGDDGDDEDMAVDEEEEEEEEIDVALDGAAAREDDDGAEADDDADDADDSPDAGDDEKDETESTPMSGDSLPTPSASSPPKLPAERKAAQAPPIPNAPPPSTLRRKKAVAAALQDDALGSGNASSTDVSLSSSPVPQPMTPSSPRAPATLTASKLAAATPTPTIATTPVPIDPSILDWTRARGKPTGSRIEKCKLFGTPLAERLRFERQTTPDAAVPNVVRQCCEYLRANNRMQTDGLFRISATSKDVTNVIERLEAGEDVKFSTIDDVHIVGNLLKRYFIALPDELLPPQQVLPIAREIDGSAAPAVEPLAARYRAVVNKLPTAQATLLRTLLWLLRDVADRADTNRMTPSNLAVVFGPSLYRSDVPGADDLGNSRLMSAALCFMLEHMEECVGARPASAGAAPAVTPPPALEVSDLASLVQSCVRQIEMQSIVLSRTQTRLEELEQAMRKLEQENVQLKFMLSEAESGKKGKKKK
jgi:hypothetical protein